MKKTLFLILSILSTSLYSQNPFLLKQAEEGSLDAQKYLAEKYFEGAHGYNQSYQKAFKYYKMAAQQGDADAQLKTYIMLSEGKGVNKDEKEALDWLIKCAAQDNQIGLLRLGVYYYDNKEYRNAYNTMKRAESLFGDHPWSCEVLGRLYMWGNGVEINYELSRKYFLEALSYEGYRELEPGIINILIGMMYHKGLGVNKDLNKAKEYYKHAIEKSPNDIRFWDILGQLYLETDENDEVKKIWHKILSLDPNISSSQSVVAVAMSGNIDYLIPKITTENNNTYAIVIANENYKRVPNVPYAINDGKIFYKYLMSSFGVPEGNIEYLEDASLNDIKYALSNVAQRCQAFKDQCSVIVYYAGHGVPDDKTAEAFLLPVDGFGTDPSSGLNLDDFYATLSEMQAKSVVVLLDACFSGAKRDGGMLMATRGITIKPKMHVPDGKLIVLSATSNEETAFPIEDQKHGLFTYTLLRKIQETGGDITWGELADHVTETVKNRSIDLNGKLQTPTVSVSSSMKEIWRNLKLR